MSRLDRGMEQTNIQILLCDTAQHHNQLQKCYSNSSFAARFQLTNLVQVELLLSVSTCNQIRRPISKSNASCNVSAVVKYSFSKNGFPASSPSNFNASEINLSTEFWSFNT